MPKKIHDKVDDLLSSDSFYPEKSEKEREELAWPIATNIVKESSFNLKRFTYAQAEDTILKSTNLKDFANKFAQYTSTLPGMTSAQAYKQYLTRNPTFIGKKLTGFPAFRLLSSKLNEQQKAFTADEIEQTLLIIVAEDASRIAYNEELTKEPPAADTSSAPVADVTKRPGITGDNVVNNLPGPGATGNYGTPGIQGITQFTSQSAARAPKTKEQVEASERMFMMDNNDALRVLSRNILDPVAYKNFQKDVVMSKNHFGTRFEAPVNNLQNLYNDLINASDSKTRNKLGAQIQHIIQNQLLGSGVRPSVVDLKNDPYSKTDYLYSGKKAPTPYIFRYLEDVYKDSVPVLQKQFDEDRKTEAAERGMTVEQMKEENFPDELKLVAKPGSPMHERAWMEKNKKTEMDKLGNQPVKDSSLKTTEGEGFKEPLGEPNKTGPAFDNPPKSGTPAPASDGTTKNSKNLQKLKYNNRTTTKS